jgi:hypothetical protein
MLSLVSTSYIARFNIGTNLDDENSLPSQTGESGSQHESGGHNTHNSSGEHHHGQSDDGEHNHNLGDDHHEGHDGDHEPEAGGGGSDGKSPHKEVKSAFSAITKAFGAVLSTMGLASLLSPQKAVNPKVIDPNSLNRDKINHVESNSNISNAHIDKGKTENYLEHMTTVEKKEIKVLGEHLTPHSTPVTSASKDATVLDKEKGIHSHQQQHKEQKDTNEHTPHR